jgi:hypothetical protein
MRNNEENFRRFIKDISQKVQNAQIIITSISAVDVETELNIVRYPLEGLSNNDMYTLIIPPNKTLPKFNKELLNMCTETE